MAFSRTITETIPELGYSVTVSPQAYFTYSFFNLTGSMGSVIPVILIPCVNRSSTAAEHEKKTVSSFFDC